MLEKRAITKTILEQVRLKVFSESCGHVREQHRGIYCALWRHAREILHAMSTIVFDVPTNPLSKPVLLSVTGKLIGYTGIDLGRYMLLAVRDDEVGMRKNVFGTSVLTSLHQPRDCR